LNKIYKKKLEHKQQIDQKCVQFAKTIQQLNLFIEDAHSQLLEPHKTSSLQEVESIQGALDKLEKSYTEQQKSINELKQLHKEVTEDKENPEIYTTITLKQISSKFEGIHDPLKKKKDILVTEKNLQQEHETLVKSYSTKYSDYTKFIDDSTTSIQKELKSALEEQLKQVKEMGTSFTNDSKKKLKELTELFNKIETADISEKVAAIQEAHLNDSKLVKTVSKRIEALESSILSKKQSNISEEQLKEFRDTFRHFDKGNTGNLGKLQFKSACAAIGEDIPDSKLEDTFNNFDKDKDGKISFDEFISFVSSVAKAGMGKNDILGAFRDLSAGSDFITEAQIRSNFDKEQAENFLSTMKKTDSGYDYQDYCNRAFS